MLLAQLPQTLRECKLDFDELRLTGGQTEKISSITHSPSSGFQLPALVVLHG